MPKNQNVKTRALAGKLYTRYCKAVGGKNFQGDPLPDWDTFVADPGKQLQAEAWIEVAEAAFDELD